MNPNVNVDLIGQNSVQGEVAAFLQKNKRLDPGRMRPWLDDHFVPHATVYVGGPKDKLSSYRNVQVNAGTLRRDEWKALDSAVLQISRSRLGGVQDLISNGLVYNLGNAMATTVFEYHDISDSMEAIMTMDGVTRSEGDRPVYGTNYLPIPIVHSDFEINQRVLEASRNSGNPLDTTMVEHATRKVLEKIENMLFTDTTYAYGGGTIYSYVNAPKRNTLTSTTVWDDSATGANILSDVKRMKQALINDKHYGPYMIYIPTAYETKMDDDYTTGYPKSVRSRIMELPNIKGIQVVDTLADDTVLMVQMTSDVVRLINGMSVQILEWKNEGGLVTHFKVMAIQVPQIRNDQAGASGLLHMSLT
jgi:uncharacterized linocin/CFP29 family protein